MIAGPKRKCNKAGRVADRYPCGEPDLDRLAARAMRAAQACRQGCSIVGDDRVPRAEQRSELGARHVPHSAARINDQQFRGLPVGSVGGAHGCAPTSCLARLGMLRPSFQGFRPRSPQGLRNVDGSASGIACACSGVSMSPGSRERKPTPWDFASSAQMAVRCRSAALLAP